MFVSVSFFSSISSSLFFSSDSLDACSKTFRSKRFPPPSLPAPVPFCGDSHGCLLAFQTTLTHLRTRHPDFLPRRGENLPRRGKKLPRLPGKTTTQINSNLNHQKTKTHGRRNRNSSRVRIHARSRKRRTQRMVTIIEQTLNKH